MDHEFVNKNLLEISLKEICVYILGVLPLSATRTSPWMLFSFRKLMAFATQIPTVRSSFKQGRIRLSSICGESIESAFMKNGIFQPANKAGFLYYTLLTWDIFS